MAVKEWTGELVGQMHNCKITQQQLADQLGVTNRYVNMVLNGHRNPADAEERFRKALKEIVDSSEQDHSNTLDVQ